ncbi:hypothetical protein G4G28_09665 [Massilia sp. Dwa41.01b]|uniref:hypothetical protein n=1 Tax=unclassified Massilia TaxID=2609279 RepID=UPI0016009CD1|nr:MULTISPECIES: hypothetical protein [unclassified Massilia]QNA88689.1 hypothetical protein G4G28_09665 [Massilia sp. Dwa41.01b]QNA99589.1 hypothetical protein G4G31_13340 [Massilia sp. Se16.2.3]
MLTNNETSAVMGRMSSAQDQVQAAVACSAAVTVLTNANGNLTKTFFLDESGTIRKQAAAKLVYGSYQVHDVTNLAELDAILDMLAPTQAATYGRPVLDQGDVVAQSVTNPAAGAITRTRQNFQFGDNAGILMLDYDPPKGAPALSQGELLQIVRSCCTPLSGVAMLWRASASSGINGAGVTGQRIYLIVSKASEIPRIGKLIFERLWLAGSGYFAVSKSGQLLERGPVDASVWKPEGLDFAAQPVLDNGIVRTCYEGTITGAGILDVAEVHELTEAEVNDLKEIKSTARAAMAPQVQAAKAQYITEVAPVIGERLRNLSLDTDQAAISLMLERATMQRTLMGDFPLITAEGKPVTVGAVMDNPEKWHGARFADPLEPEVDGRVAWLNLRSGGNPYLYSHLHHGTYYRLDRAPALIEVSAGELPRMVDSMALLLKKSGQMYERAGVMVYVSDEGKIVQAVATWMKVFVHRLCRFEQYNVKKQEMVVAECPQGVVQGLLANAAHTRMPRLTAVRDVPTMDANGRLIAMPGYDEPSGLLLRNEKFVTWPAVRLAPSQSDLKNALQTLWKPFEQFPYVSAADRSVALAAALTAAVRCCLRTAPGFGFSATAPGTGKTLLAQCIGVLYDGTAPAVSAPITHEEEWAKSLFSSALAGAGTLLFDNAEHAIESASLCAVTTAPAIKGRVLGESREAEAEHRLLVLATGNGLQLVGDLNRRFLTCRLDAQVEASKVAGRQFDLEPLGYCLKNRLLMITAALTLIQGYVAAGFPKVCDGLASMDDWNKLVRSTIVWLSEQGLAAGFVDPKAALLRDSANDPEAAALAVVLEMAKMTFGPNAKFTVAELVKRTSTTEGWGDLLKDIAGDYGGVDARRLGKWLLKREGRIINCMSLKRAGLNRTKTALWSISEA